MEAGEWELYFDVEIWNRRKYPFIIREATIYFQSTEVTLDPIPPKDGNLSWKITNQNSLKLPEDQGFSIEPSSHAHIHASAKYSDRLEVLLDNYVEVKFIGFDPVKNRRIELRKSIFFGSNKKGAVHQVANPAKHT